MKTVLISIQPKWCELIANGKKTVEIRKTRPKIDTPFKCYIYCTKGKNTNENLWLENNGYNRLGNGKVIGEFICDKIVFLGNISTDPWEYLMGDIHERHKKIVTKQACLSEGELLAYGGKYAWHISNPVIYDEPKELSKFIVERYPCLARLKRPPQSWCYVEEVQE